MYTAFRMRLLPFPIFLSAIFLSKFFLLNASNMLAPFLALFQIHNLSIWTPISPARRWTACSKWLLRKKADPGKSGRADQRPLCGALLARSRDEEFSVAYRRIGLRFRLEGVFYANHKSGIYERRENPGQIHDVR